MNNNKKIFTVHEFEEVVVDNKDDPLKLTISPQSFQEIIDIFKSDDLSGNSSIRNFLNVGYNSIKRKQVLKFKNYVGSFILNKSIVFEILPKISMNKTDIKSERSTVIKMLEKCEYINSKISNNSTIDVEKVPIFEFYITIFIKELYDLIKCGLYSNYSSVEGNSKVLKGKVLFSKNILVNHSHKEFFYVEYDIFGFNVPENRIIKSTLYLLRKITTNFINLRKLNECLIYFEDVPVSNNIDKDLSKCLISRHAQMYENVIKYAKLFLRGNGLSIFSGNKNIPSLLFPMELLFQEYVYKHVNETLINKSFITKKQVSGVFLFKNSTRFALCPDIVSYKNGISYIFDTKRKKINDEGDISQTDMYQMFAYHKNFKGVQKVVLLYPQYTNQKNMLFKNDDITIEARTILLPIEDHKEEFINTILSIVQSNVS